MRRDYSYSERAPKEEGKEEIRQNIDKVGPSSESRSGNRGKKGEGFGGESGALTADYGQCQRVVDRLLHYRGVLRVRAWHRGPAQDQDADLGGLLSIR